VEKTKADLREELAEELRVEENYSPELIESILDYVMDPDSVELYRFDSVDDAWAFLHAEDDK